MWFPDGRRLAYTSERGEMNGLFAVDLVTRREELVVDLARASIPPSAAPLKGPFVNLQLSPSLTRAAYAVVTRPDSGTR